MKATQPIIPSHIFLYIELGYIDLGKQSADLFLQLILEEMSKNQQS